MQNRYKALVDNFFIPYFKTKKPFKKVAKPIENANAAKMYANSLTKPY